MLSFDITDRNIRIIKAKENNGKVKILSSLSVDVDDGIIVNGFIKNIPFLANLINQALKEKRISDREAVVSISSNLIMFRELNISKSANATMKTLVRNELQNAMNVSDEHNISYTVAGESKNATATQTKVLANACPREVIDCYRRLFSLLSISLKSVAASCNCISRLILSDPKIANKMPMLLVQIDPNFININVYQDSQLTFSRFASISPDDYDDRADYIFQAINENVTRMFQFQRTRSSQNISNVIFYGDTSEFIRLTNYLEQSEVTASLLSVPNTVSGYENLEFAHFANAIGAVFLNKKEYESANLLNTEGAAVVTAADGASVDEKKTITQALGIFIGSAAVLGAIYFAIFLMGKQTQNKISQIETYMNSDDTKQIVAEIDKKTVMLDKLQSYKSKVQKLKDSEETYPEIDTVLLKTVTDCTEGKGINKIAYKEGVMDITIDPTDFTFPAKYAENITALNQFDNILYVGFSEKEDDKKTGAGSTVNQDIVDPETGEVIGTVTVKTESQYESVLEFQLRAQIPESKANQDNAQDTAPETEQKDGE